MIAILDYGMGNVGSILRMLTRVNAPAVITADPDAIAAAQKLVLPGVGSFDAGMSRLRESGLLDALQRRVLDDEVPVLGICLGMQLLTRTSEEGNSPGLGWVDADVVRFKFSDDAGTLKVPHMGWNHVALSGGQDDVHGMATGSRYYFLHSYHVVCDRDDDVVATTSFGYEFTSVIRSRHILGVQFHPEKSLQAGIRLFDDFAHHF